MVLRNKSAYYLQYGGKWNHTTEHHINEVFYHLVLSYVTFRNARCFSSGLFRASWKTAIFEVNRHK